MQAAKKILDDNKATPIAILGRYAGAYTHIRKVDWWDANLCGGPIVEQVRSKGRQDFCLLLLYNIPADFALYIPSTISLIWYTFLLLATIASCFHDAPGSHFHTLHEVGRHIRLNQSNRGSREQDSLWIRMLIMHQSSGVCRAAGNALC